MNHSNRSDFIKLKELISNNQILLLPHKKYKGLRQAIFYARCGISQSYFEKSYKNKELVLQFGELGPRVGYPLSWEEAMSNFLNNKM